MPESTGERSANDLTWSLYTFEVQGIPRALALAPERRVDACGDTAECTRRARRTVWGGLPARCGCAGSAGV